MLDTVINAINDALYSYALIIILILGGIYFTFRTRFAQFRLLGAQFKSLKQGPTKKGGVSSFQALMVSTASRVGTGNIIGVSTAICLGGFGAVFWMWVIAIIGACSALVESTLAQIFKKKGKDGCYGGPSYYIEQGLGLRWLGVIFSVCLIVTYGVGFNMLASYNLQSTFSGYSFYDPSVTPWIIGAIVAAAVAYCTLGGGKRILKVSSLLVPVMGVAYIAIALITVILNITSLPDVFTRIFAEAFDIKAIFGGFGGSCVMYGIKRGLFSNEAGVGSAPNAAAAAEVDHPVQQGLVQVLSVFIDTLLVCSATAFMCMCSGVEPTAELSGAPYVQAALSSSLGAFGPIFITVAMILFAFTTLIGNLFYVDKCIAHLLKKEPSKLASAVIHVVCSLLVFVGAGLSAGLLWNIADITMGVMTLINMPVIIILGRYAFRALRDYDRQRRSGEPITFKAKDVGLEDKTDFWK